MKRLFAAFAWILILCLLFASCTTTKPTAETGKTAEKNDETVAQTKEETKEETKTAAELVAQAIEKTFPEGYDLNLDLSMEQAAAGMTVKMPLKWTILSKADGSVSLQTTETQTMGIAASMQIYFAEETCYLKSSTAGVEMKYSIPEDHEEFAQGLDSGYVNLGTVSEILKDAAVKAELEKLLNGATKEIKDGVTVYSFEVKGDALSSMAEKLEEKGIVVGTREGKVSVALAKDGFLSYIELELSSEVEGATETLKGKITPNNAGKSVAITAPEDLLSYVSYEDMMGDLVGGDEEADDAALAYEAVLELYDENMEKVADYDAQIAALISLYGEENVRTAEQEVASLIELLK